jgi:hypothetical protein
MDAGSFIMEANGERWAMDFGMQDYNSLETAGVNLWGMAQNSQRWEVYRYNNFVHNTLTVNGKLQAVDGYCSIKSYSDKPDMISATTDITTLYKDDLKRAERGIAIADRKYVLIRDEIETSDKDAVVRWDLLTSANVAVIGKSIAEFTKNGKKLVLKVLSPVGAEIKTWSTVPPHSYDAPNPGSTLVGFEIKIPANSKTDLVVVMLPEGAEENVEVTVKTLKEWPK